MKNEKKKKNNLFISVFDEYSFKYKDNNMY